MILLLSNYNIGNFHFPTPSQKWKTHTEVCKWTDQKTWKIVNNGVERIIEGVKVENIKVKERAVKKIKQAVDEFRS